MRKLYRLACLVALAGFALQARADSVAAEQTLLSSTGASNLVRWRPALAANDGLWAAQTFTSMAQGELAEVVLPLWRPAGRTGSVFVEIWAASGGLPVAGTGALASKSVGLSDLPLASAGFDGNGLNWEHVDLTGAHLQLDAGNHYALVLRPDTQSSTDVEVGWIHSGSFSNPYPDGARLLQVLDGNQNVAISWTAAADFSNADFAFQVAVAPVTAVPEPGMFGMLAAGLGLAGFFARRRRG